MRFAQLILSHGQKSIHSPSMRFRYPLTIVTTQKQRLIGHVDAPKGESWYDCRFDEEFNDAYYHASPCRGMI